MNIQFLKFLLSKRHPSPNPETVKKFRQREFGGPWDARGRSKFTPPKQALVSPWPARCFTHWSRRENPFGFMKIFPNCRRRSAEALEVLYGPPSPAGFWRREFVPPPDNEKGLCIPPWDFFTASLPPRGKGREGVIPFGCGPAALFSSLSNKRFLIFLCFRIHPRKSTP